MSRALDREILAARPPKNAVDPWRPYAFSVEDELAADGRVEPVATLFLTNRECPFRCVMCDLWKNTTDETIPVGAIPAQIDFALQRLAPAPHVKLYNSGNFFDRRAIPAEDYAAIARRVSGFRTVIVENHPLLCGDECLRFRDLLPASTTLEIALGLETVHPDVLPRLNKQMTLDTFARAARFLRSHGIELRVFVLLRPPGLNDDEGVEWAVRSVQFAIEQGARVCAIIPVRPGNGLLDQWQSDGRFAPPSLRALETALDRTLDWVRNWAPDREFDGTLDRMIELAPASAVAPEFAPPVHSANSAGHTAMNAAIQPAVAETPAGMSAETPVGTPVGAPVGAPVGTPTGSSAAATGGTTGGTNSGTKSGAGLRPRVFADLWDVERLATCPVCATARRDRLSRTNFSQVRQPPVICSACKT